MRPLPDLHFHAPLPTAPHRRIRCGGSLLGAAVLVLLACSMAAAAETTDELKAAREHFQRGRIEEALEVYDALAKQEAVAVEVALGRSHCYQAEGKWSEAIQLLTAAVEKEPKNAPLQARLAELQLATGDYDAAASTIQKALELDSELPLARLVQADLQTETGKLKEADQNYRWLVRYYNRTQPKDAETLLIVGRGAAQYARWNRVSQIFSFVVNTLCADAIKAEPSNWQAIHLSGQLLLEKYNRAEALPEFRQALAINPRAAEVLISLGNAAFQDLDLDEAATYVDRALKINPRLVSGLQLKADIELQNEGTRAALALLRQALEVNPHDQQTLARVAACYILEDGPPAAKDLDQLLTHLDAPDQAQLERTGRFTELLTALAKRNPHPGKFLTVLGEQLEARRKFDLAERFYRAAIETMPQLPEPRTALGMLAMRVGKPDEARAILDEAFKADPFHVRVSNMRKVLSLLEGYETVTTDHFVIRVDSSADRILGRYMAEYLEQEYPKLVEQFGYEPPTRTQFEIYNKAKGLSAHQWFSARMVGLPWIQTIGASTGMMVALASPTAQEEPFNWARVLKHEFVHILTLQQTHFNIPHWFTEALATYYEGYPRPAKWEQLLRERVRSGDLMNLDTINFGFIRPKSPLDWTLAYCQAELYAEFMIEEFGAESIPKLLNAYRENLSTDQAIPAVFGVSKEEFEAGYLEFVRGIVAKLEVAAAEPEQSLAELEKAHLANPDDATAAGRYAYKLLEARQLKEARQIAEKTVERQKNEPLASAVLAQLELRAENRAAARATLEAALDRESPHPVVLKLLAELAAAEEEQETAAEFYELGRKKFPGREEWLKGLAFAYLKQNQNEKLKPILVELADRNSDDVAVRKKLAQLALEAKEYREAAEWARRALHIDVLDPEIHRILGEASAALNESARAVAEFEVAAELNPNDPDLELALAKAYISSGKPVDARIRLTALLKRDPSNQEAAKLLEDIE